MSNLLMGVAASAMTMLPPQLAAAQDGVATPGKDVSMAPLPPKFLGIAAAK